MEENWSLVSDEETVEVCGKLTFSTRKEQVNILPVEKTLVFSNNVAEGSFPPPLFSRKKLSCDSSAEGYGKMRCKNSTSHSQPMSLHGKTEVIDRKISSQPVSAEERNSTEKNWRIEHNYQAAVVRKLTKRIERLEKKLNSFKQATKVLVNI